jgi:hypothetical protein
VAQLGDVATIELARGVAREILSADPELQSEDHTLIRDGVTRFWADAADLS